MLRVKVEINWSIGLRQSPIDQFISTLALTINLCHMRKNKKALICLVSYFKRGVHLLIQYTACCFSVPQLVSITLSFLCLINRCTYFDLQMLQAQRD